ncbi:MAG: tetratricopeptide repeat protein, partial [Planctomycetota bacterium]|nr:tetratricopeptide repeat protein [Planctomycetota bacterium]
EKDKAADKEKEKAKRRGAERKIAEFEREVADGPVLNRAPGASHGVEGLQPMLAKINVVDRALLSAALEQYRAEKRDEAAATAARVVEKSSDADGVGAARLFLGRVALEKNQPDEARKLFRAVTGRAAALAVPHLLEPLGKPDADAEAIAKEAKDLAAAQKSALDRCRVVKAVLDYLTRPTPPGQGVPPELRVSLLLQVADWIPYEEALAAQAELVKEEPLNEGPGGPRGGMVAAREAAPPEMPREILDRLRDLRNMAPEQRKETLQHVRGMLQEQVEKLKGQGREDDANRLKEMLERFDRGGLNKGEKNGKKPEALDPEKAKAEIKRLEDQGFPEEANKLKRQLEMQEKPVGDVNDNF